MLKVTFIWRGFHSMFFSPVKRVSGTLDNFLSNPKVSLSDKLDNLATFYVQCWFELYVCVVTELCIAELHGMEFLFISEYPSVLQRFDYESEVVQNVVLQYKCRGEFIYFY